MNIEAELRNSK